ARGAARHGEDTHPSRPVEAARRARGRNPMTAAHSEMEGHAAAYVLGSLDEAERRAFEAHVAGCAECAAAVRSLRVVADGLAQAVPERTPPAHLRERVLGSFRASAPAGARVHEFRGPAARPRRAIATWLPVAASLLLTVAVGAYALRLQGRVADLESRLDTAILQASA